MVLFLHRSRNLVCADCTSTDADILDERTVTEVHFQMNVTIPLLDDLIVQLKER